MRGQLGRDCECLVNSNYVHSWGDPPVERYMTFLKPWDIAKNIGDLLTEGYPLDWASRISRDVNLEYQRRSALDDDHKRRKRRAERDDEPERAELRWWSALSLETTLHPLLLKALATNEFEEEEEVVTTLRPGRAYALPFLSEEFCEALRARLRAYEARYYDGQEEEDLSLDEIPGATEAFTDELVSRVLQPLAERFLGFSDVLDHHKAFRATNDDHREHYDNAEVAVEVHLAGDDAGELELLGYKHDPADAVVAPHRKIGFAVLKLGDELHRRRRRRRNESSTSQQPEKEEDTPTRLVVWARSTHYRVTHGCPMCGTTKYLRRNVLLGDGGGVGGVLQVPPSSSSSSS